MSHHNSRFDALDLNFSPMPLVFNRYLPILRISYLLGSPWTWGESHKMVNCVRDFRTGRFFNEFQLAQDSSVVPLCCVVTSFYTPLQDLALEPALRFGSFIESKCCEDLINQEWLQLHSTFTPRYSSTSPSSVISNLAAIPFMDSI